MPREPGRNDPFSCGSGRKYKHCCLRAIDVLQGLIDQQVGRPLLGLLRSH
jgi:hypothetical protein